MEHILNTLPMIFIYWASGLIVWSGIVCAMQFKIILASREVRNYTRRSDTLILITVIVGAMMLFIATFVIPTISILFVEVCLLLALWWTVFLMMLNHLNITCWVKYCTTKTLDWSLFPAICITGTQRKSRTVTLRHTSPSSK